MDILDILPACIACLIFYLVVDVNNQEAYFFLSCPVLVQTISMFNLSLSILF